MATANETLISVKGLKKHFGKLQVLKGVDIDIHSGEVVVVIGLPVRANRRSCAASICWKRRRRAT